MEAASFNWTVFKDATAQAARSYSGTLGDLAQALESAGPFASKSECPLVSLARFDGTRTAAGSLRSAGAVTAVFGAIGDYDGGVISPEEAIAMLERALVRAIVYTTPSHTPEKPRWRVISPFSAEIAPDQYGSLVARLNGVLGGILAPESFSVAQSF